MKKYRVRYLSGEVMEDVWNARSPREARLKAYKALYDEISVGGTTVEGMAVAVLSVDEMEEPDE
jgi:hypothetical protein